MPEKERSGVCAFPRRPVCACAFPRECCFAHTRRFLRVCVCSLCSHVTDATNTENIAFVWKATKHIILEQNLTRSGLLMC